MTTKIIIPGREAQTLTGMTMNVEQVKAAYAGQIDLSAYNVDTQVEDGVTVITFSNRTGTKGTDMQVINEAGSNPVFTTIIIPGREAQTIPGMELGVDDVVAAFAGQIDLRNYESQVAQEETGPVITFANRTGTKGNGMQVINEAGSNPVFTTIIIPGREAQTIPGMELGVDDVVAAFAGQIDLRNYESSVATEETGPVITFSNRTGTKGNDLFDVLSQALASTAVEEPAAPAGPTGTKILIPGREAQTIPGMLMDAEQVKAAYQGQIDLSAYNVDVQVDGEFQVVTFTNRTGTKGAVLDDSAALKHTKIVIPGREAQVISNMVLDASGVKAAYAGQIDLSAYNVEETEDGETLVVTFSNRTGTKGA